MQFYLILGYTPLNDSKYDINDDTEDYNLDYIKNYNSKCDCEMLFTLGPRNINKNKRKHIDSIIIDKLLFNELLSKNLITDICTLQVCSKLDDSIYEEIDTVNVDNISIKVIKFI